MLTEDKGHALLSEFRRLLLNFIEKPPNLNNNSTLSTLIRNEACNTLTAAFAVLYPQPTAQISFLLDAITQVRRIIPFHFYERHKQFALFACLFFYIKFKERECERKKENAYVYM
jgi:hypothetical protein